MFSFFIFNKYKRNCYIYIFYIYLYFTYDIIKYDLYLIALRKIKIIDTTIVIN